MIHYFCHKDKCFRITDSDAVFVHPPRNAPKSFAQICEKTQKFEIKDKKPEKKQLHVFPYKTLQHIVKRSEV